MTIVVDPESTFDLCEKRKAVLSGDGHALIIGGPGSGKTTIALLKARRLVLEGLEAHRSVLFLSFSKAATRRIMESAADILTPDVARQISIKTYHSFAWEILRSHGYLISSKRTLSIVAAQDAAVLKAGLEDEAWAEEQDRLFLEEGRVTYDQFAGRCADILEGSTKAMQCYSAAHPVIFVDEFQDTDAPQWRLVRSLGGTCTVIALGDTEQRIYAWRPGVDPKRLQDFAAEFDAQTFDFGTENHRSPTTGIAGYARALMSTGTVPEAPKDIKFAKFGRGQGRFVATTKIGVLHAWRETRRRTKRPSLTIAVAARSRQLVRLVSDALAQTQNIQGKQHGPMSHDVLIDQTQIVLAARVVAYIMGASEYDPHERLARALELVGDVFKASGNKTNIEKSQTLERWASKCREGKQPSTKCVKALSSAIDQSLDEGLIGSPTQDWLSIRRLLGAADAPDLKKVAEHARFLRLLRRGSLIEETLSELWRRTGTYAGADQALENAIVQNQLLETHRDNAPISVMTMHQLKGREFDAVVLIEDEHRTFRGRESAEPYPETRRLLNVSLTRARHYAVVLSSAQNSTFDVIFDE